MKNITYTLDKNSLQISAYPFKITDSLWDVTRLSAVTDWVVKYTWHALGTEIQ